MKPARSSGFTLVEILLSTGILVVLFAAITAMMQMSLRTVGQARTKTTGQQLLQEKMELIRNMPYTDVGTVGGVPNGVLEQVEEIEFNGATYTVTTDITYIDDSFDGVAPDDTLPTDYKRVRISVNWDGVFQLPSALVLMTDVVSKGLESDEGGGTLVVQVLDADGLPVQAADVHIESDAVSPVVNLDTITGVDGLVELPGVQECIECYEISVTKDGFTTDRTYGVEEVTNPHQPHVTVLEGEVNQSTFVIDETSQLQIFTYTYSGGSYIALPNHQINVKGTKEIGRNEFDQPVYKTDLTANTDGLGRLTLTGMEWDMYSLNSSTGSLDLRGYWPPQPFSLLPQTQKLAWIILDTAYDNNLIVFVTDNENNPLEGVSVSLENEAVSYSAAGLTPDLNAKNRGQVYFGELPETEEPYTLELSLEGYDFVTTEATVSGDVVEELIMNPTSP